ncbi:MAG: hypothetical protein INR73_13150 [Williamsia sp.]|nr:hypothetical protein [Williamsia sp.]
MMIERNEFRIKFGKMKEAKTLWLQIIQVLKPELDAKLRLLTDLTGPAYTLVLESELKDFQELTLQQEKWKASSRVAELYRQFIEVCNSSERTLYTLENEN